MEKVEQITSATNFMVKETELLSSTVEKFWLLESYGTCQKDDVSVLPLQE